MMDVASPSQPAMKAEPSEGWHARAVEDAYAHFGTGPEGLSELRAREQLERYGPNRLPPPKTRGPFRRLLVQFDNLLIQVLLGAAAITAGIGHWTDAAVILAVCLVNAAVGFVQEGKAEAALRAISGMLPLRATVLRGGQRITVPADALVSGDLVLLESGDKVPADLRLVRVKGLQVQEAALTGESVPVAKRTSPVEAGAPLGDRGSMAFSGTLVTAGRGSGVVVASGARTEIGRIGSMLAEVEPLTTPLLRQMSAFARRLTITVVATAVLVFSFGVFARGYDTAAMFLAVVSLAVASIPEGLPAILTIAMAIGVQRMAARNAITRRLPAVETLGSVSVICSDKTGTLTRNEMTVQTVVAGSDLFEVSGVGYDPHGDVVRRGSEMLPDECLILLEMAQVAVLCNDAGLRRVDDAWAIDGDPMEGALLVLALKIGLDLGLERKRLPRTDLIPFEAEHRFMATLNHDHEGRGFIYVKGAPERLLTMCSWQREPGGGEATLDAPYWHGRIEKLASQGQRVLAIATRRTDGSRRELRFADVEQDLTLLGLFGLIDPPREEAIEAVRACQAAGVRVKMITGDHAATARAIAQQLGFANTGEALTGRDLEQLSDEDLRGQAPEIDVFARASPEHKLRLVQALQAQGYVVAMTGDGVNDAPALRRADVGVAMGVKGTEAAKDAAEVVLADDNFASIANAIREGRTVYDNLKKAIVFLLPINGGESLSIVAAILLGTMLPITPLQILWVNMVSSLGLALALAFEPTEPDVMARAPRPANEPILSGFLLWRIALVSTLFLAGIFGMFQWSLHRGTSLEEARTLAVNTLVVLEVFYLFSVRYLRTPSLTSKGVLGTRSVVLAVGAVTTLQLVFTYAPFMERFFHSRPISIVEGLPVIAIGMLLFAVLEIEKLVRRRLGLNDGA
jgi:magnesium-transporting ATPase (P-type)